MADGFKIQIKNNIGQASKKDIRKITVSQKSSGKNVTIDSGGPPGHFRLKDPQDCLTIKVDPSNRKLHSIQVLLPSFSDLTFTPGKNEEIPIIYSHVHRTPCLRIPGAEPTWELNITIPLIPPGSNPTDNVTLEDDKPGG
ncbi:hypothetical protein ACFLQP_02455 [Acidobacteriota bacterium]